jgi:DNA-directed RNA polymerase specialized sigma24 family protein
LYYFVRRQLAYREAVADLVPGALRTEEVIDHVVIRAYMASTLAEDDDVAVTVRRLALDEIHAHLPKGIPNDRPTILYFFESDGGGAIEPSGPSGPASEPERQAENDAVRRAFENSLAGMPAVWRQVMLLHHVDGLSGAAVARAVGRPESDVQRMIGHACAYLRERLFEAREVRD